MALPSGRPARAAPASTAIGLVLVVVLVVFAACRAVAGPDPVTAAGSGRTLVPFGFWSLMDNSGNQVVIAAGSSCATDLVVTASVRGGDDLVALRGAVRPHCTEGARSAERISVVLARYVGCGAGIIDASTGHEAPRAPHAPPPPQFSCPAAPALSRPGS